MSEVQKQQTINWLILIRNKVLELADIKNGEYVADFGCGSGLLGFGVLEKFEDRVKLIFSDKFLSYFSSNISVLDASILLISVPAGRGQHRLRQGRAAVPCKQTKS